MYIEQAYMLQWSASSYPQTFTILLFLRMIEHKEPY